MNNTKQKFSYRRFHALIMCISVTPVILYIFNAIKGKQYGDKLSILLGMAILIVLQGIIQSRFYTMERKDELVQYNLARANKITLYTVLAVLFVSVILNDYLIKGLVCSDFCWITVMGAIALRSFLFTVFDSPAEPADGNAEE